MKSLARTSSWFLVALALVLRAVFGAQAVAAAQTCPPAPGQGLWDVRPATCDQYTAGPEETFYVGDVYVRLVRPVVPSGVKVPVILVYSPYSHAFTTTGDVPGAGTLFGGDPNSFDAMPLKGFFVPKGYALAVADVPGTGNSGGCWDMLGAREQLAGHDLVEWLGTRHWSNGKVGMIGISYAGATGIMTAVARPPHLATIVAEFPLSSVYDIFYHDAIRYAAGGPYDVSGLAYVNHLDIPAIFDFGLAMLPPSNPQDTGYEARLLERACHETKDKLTHTQRGYELDPAFDAFWQERNFVKDAAKLAMPARGTRQEISVLVSGGWTDELAKSPHQTRWFEAVPVDDLNTATDEGVPFKMLVMGNRAHAIQSPDFRDASLLHAWFDRFLYGRNTNIENQPPVWSKANDQEVRDASSWPIARTGAANLFLHSNSGLTPKPSRAPEFLGSYADTGLETDSQVFALRQASGVHFLWFETAPFVRDMRIAGRPSLELLASTSTTSTHFTPVLFDLGPQSESSLFKVNGNQECELLEEQEVCILSRGFLNARFKDGLEQGTDLVPGTSYKASIRFVDKDWVIKKGHRIGLAVMSSNTDYALPDQQRALNSLFSERGARSRLVLPVVGGEKALEDALGR